MTNDDEASAELVAALSHRGLRTRTWLLLLGVALVAGGVIGWIAHPDSQSPATSAARPFTSAPPPSAGPVLSPRGNLRKGLGEMAQVCADRDCAGRTVAMLTVDAIQVDPPCEADHPDLNQSRNGHLIAVSMTITTTPQFDVNRDGSFTNITPSDFSVVGPDEVAENSVAPGFCVPKSERLPYGETLLPGATYKGKVVLDTRNTSGVLVLRIIGVPTGWEWTF